MAVSEMAILRRFRGKNPIKNTALCEVNMNIEYYKRSPTVFLEEYYGIKLSPHQKLIIDKMYNAPKKYYYVPARESDFGSIKLLSSIMNLEDGAIITAISPNGIKEITKEQFIGMWVNVYKKERKTE